MTRRFRFGGTIWTWDLATGLVTPARVVSLTEAQFVELAEKIARLNGYRCPSCGSREKYSGWHSPCCGVV